MDTNPTAFAPERVLVFEILGELGDFAKAARRIGLEWLAERIVTLLDPEIVLRTAGDGEDGDVDDEVDGVDFVLQEDEKPSEAPGRLYFAMPTLEAFRRLKSLWDRFKLDGSLPSGHSDWRDLFHRLHDLRAWGPADRVAPHTQTHLGRQLAEEPASRLNVELDLWYRADERSRSAAFERMRSQLSEVGGILLDSAEMPDVHYHAALVSLPPGGAAELVQLHGPLASSREVMSVRPQSMFRAVPSDNELQEDTAVDRVLAERDGRPSLAALVDGLPVENHVLLQNRLDVVDIGVVSASVPLPRRRHATAMASLILHGDLQDGEPPIDRVLKVVPILSPTADGTEQPPSDKLAVKLICEAIEDLKNGRDGNGPSGRDVILVNHSVCDEANPFTGAMSHWARVLDHLSYKHGILFVASAGNIRSGFPVSAYATVSEFHKADPKTRRSHILRAVDAAKAERGMYSPAESLNALTVGAAHADGSTRPVPSNIVDPFGEMRMSNLGSRVGLGFGRAVKPDVLMPGGRQAAQGSLTPLSVRGFDAGACFGQLAAAPDQHGGSFDRTFFTSGTSNAAALATRAGLLIADALDETYEDRDLPWYRQAEAACMLKALVAHSAAWGAAGEELDSLLPPTESRRHVPRRSNISRYLGYGLGDVGRIIDASQHRVTLLATDLIRKNQRHEYRIPLPSELASRTDVRRVTVTLGWLTPLFHQRTNYRAVALQVVGSDGSSHLWEGVKRVPLQPPLGATTRGTLFHTIYEGDRAVPFGPDAEILLNVQASSRLTGPISRENVPYALAVSLEVAPSLDADIFTSVANRLRPPIGARA